jgi:hypothetical protein
MKTQLDAQRVHDMFVAILTGEVNVPLGKDTLAVLSASTHVLCWMLEHKHGLPNDGAFGELLDYVEQAAKDAGYTLVDHGN